MSYLRVREINIDVIPGAEPFISLTIEKVITDAEGNTLQIIGFYDRIIKRLSEVVLQPSGNVAADGHIDGMELYLMIATVAYTWMAQKHGGQIIDGYLVVP